MKTISLLLLLACVACSNSHALTACHGTYQAANPAKWTPTPADLSAETNQ